MVELNTKADKIEVLKSAKKLRVSTHFNNVYVGPDQTLAERVFTKGLIKQRNEENNKLVEGCGFRYGIRNRKVVKVWTSNGSN